MSRLEALQAMLQKEPTDALLHYMLANEYFNAGQYLECVTTMQKYLTLTEDEGAAYRMLAQALVKLGKVSEAREAYQAGIRAAQKFGHPSMVEEYEETVKTLE
ncbi:MAG: CDC27 family protein [Candidatus Methylomirabilales bacterium]